MTVARVLAGEARWHVEQGDCLDALRAMPDASVDAVVTDPPAGIAFMGKGWDTDKGGRDVWIAWLAEIMREALRALKPGGHALVWALPRTSHWTATAVEDAGFEIRDVGVHLFGSGFPKSLDVSKVIDKVAGAERKVIGSRARPDGSVRDASNGGARSSVLAGGASGALNTNGAMAAVTAPATPLAEQWSGWGTALKPASEHWILARKPLVGTVAANVAEYGTGAINVDACRISAPDAPDVPDVAPNARARFVGVLNGGRVSADEPRTTSASRAGRWPANVVISHLPECREVGVRRVRGSHSMGAGTARSVGYGGGSAGKNSKDTDHTNPDGTETVPAYDCAPGCAAAALDEQSEGASRFYYVAKASRAERNAGCEHLSAVRWWDDAHQGTREGTNETAADGVRRPRESRNHHPTVKPIALMRWLARLVTPPGGVVLDPFNGSGSTGCACVLEGLRYVGIEREPEYIEIARARIAHWEAQATAPAKPRRTPKPRPAPPPPSSPRPVADERQLDLLARLA